MTTCVLAMLKMDYGATLRTTGWFARMETTPSFPLFENKSGPLLGEKLRVSENRRRSGVTGE